MLGQGALEDGSNLNLNLVSTDSPFHLPSSSVCIFELREGRTPPSYFLVCPKNIEGLDFEASSESYKEFFRCPLPGAERDFLEGSATEDRHLLDHGM